MEQTKRFSLPSRATAVFLAVLLLLTALTAVIVPQINKVEAAGTVINVSTGRVEIDGTTARQYSGTGDTLVNTFTNADSTYTLTGTASITMMKSYVLVKSGTTANLTFDNLNISIGRTTIYGSVPSAAVETSHADVTITLKDGTTNNLKVVDNHSGYGVGCLVKDGMDGKLTIQCEHAGEPGHKCTATCGTLVADARAETMIHATAIGSSAVTPSDSVYISSGFSNFYVLGGNITSYSGIHAPAIGSMCGNTYCSNTTHTVCTVSNAGGDGNPNAYVSAANQATSFSAAGQICKNLNFSGGIIKAYGGHSCAGIGSGWSGPVDGIHISGTAYVYATGGLNSPGIGVGGNYKGYPDVQKSSYSWWARDIVISGGQTVVEAIGGSSDVANYNVPGIGIGLCDNPVVGNAAVGGQMGAMTNVVADPDEGWLALVKQGSTAETAVYQDGCPSVETCNILTDQFYNKVYFANVDKTASVNGGETARGTAENKIGVYEGDTIKYIINTATWNENVTATTGTLTDPVPAGLTVSTEPGSFRAGMKTKVENGVTIVYWENVPTNTEEGPNTEYFFTTTVGEVPQGGKDYINQASFAIRDPESGQVLNVPSLITYHRADSILAVDFNFTNEREDKPWSNGKADVTNDMPALS